MVPDFNLSQLSTLCNQLKCLFSPLRGSETTAMTKASDKRSSSTKEDKSHVSRRLWFLKKSEFLPILQYASKILTFYFDLAGEPAEKDLPAGGAAPHRDAAKGRVGAEMQVFSRIFINVKRKIFTWCTFELRSLQLFLAKLLHL